MTMRQKAKVWMRYRFYVRRAKRLRTVAGFLGTEAAIEYGQRRGWIERIEYDPQGRKTIYLGARGRCPTR